MSNAAAIADDNARISVLDAVRAMTGPVTVADVVARTGLPPYQAEEQLNQIVRDYESDLDVDDDGNLVYRFQPGLPGREDIVKKDAARRRKEAFKKGLIAFFKAWTVAMVIIYFVLYVVLIIAALAASQNREGSNNSRRRSFGGGGGMWLWWGMGSPWGYGGYGTYTSRAQRRRYNADVEARLGKGEDPYALDDRAEVKKPSLTERTWYWLFGTKGIKKNPLEAEKELLTYIRAKKGFISNADIIALLGVTYDEADKIGTRLVATYDGEMDLTDDGVAIYRFPNLMLTGAPHVAAQTPDLGYLWQVRKKEEALRQNPAKAVPILNGINILLSFVILFYAMPRLGISGIGAVIGLFIVPLVFSLTFFALGMMRKAREAADAGKYQRDSIRAAMFKLLFTRRTAVRLPGDERAINSVGLGSWSEGELAAVASEVATELRGEADKDGGILKIRTPRVWAEMAATEKLRGKASSARQVGRTVFSTRGGGGGGGEVVEGGGGAASDDAALAAEIAALEKELSN
ncbi:MAG: hypothetical protein CVU56_25470 [Deltaproteobacteria bacterium HGW-Deltaproteobacteria-14]|nr:MAG: hypothetical protein CVU56_25470 [Deltaproteobacteria bacterium HGW-Deltaproteobacteria-14]